jgi:NAD+ kinase
MEGARISRLGLVVHPERDLRNALETIRRWSDERGVEVVQVPSSGQHRRVAEPGEAADCDLIVALGGDGTTLAALRSGAEAGRPVLGVACGSLGALTAVTAPDIEEALGRFAAGDWEPRSLPALAAESDGAETLTGLNDLVIVRQGAGQVSAEVRVDGDLFIRFAGDGLVVGTPLGSSAYTLAAGGPVLAPGGSGLVITPLAPHGGCCPPLVAGMESRLTIVLDPGHGGARIELDGQVRAQAEPHSALRTFEVSLRRDHATLVALGGEEALLAGLRRRRVIMDSPRVLARDDREQAAGREQRTGNRIDGYKGKMALLELVQQQPDWMEALGVALSRPPGTPERRAGEDPWAEEQGASERPRRVSDDLAWLRQAIDEPESNGLHGLDDTAAVAAWEIEPEAAARLDRLRERRVLEAAGFLLHD